MLGVLNRQRIDNACSTWLSHSLTEPACSLDAHAVQLLMGAAQPIYNQHHNSTMHHVNAQQHWRASNHLLVTMGPTLNSQFQKGQSLEPLEATLAPNIWTLAQHETKVSMEDVPDSNPG